ncbi:hypothetical protein [Marinomonas atlantica]|uniref:hypothetical protein n=1 Tax=Marinomonas atlantica TaxID=1806668 RepID=UPI00082C325D|nr:hypothetical protein [Marinomonas atlantica]
MRDIQASSQTSVISALFNIESSIYESKLAPLKSYLTIQSLLTDLKYHLSEQSQLYSHLNLLINDFATLIEQGTFFNDAQMACWMAWTSEFRSLYVAELAFSNIVETDLLENIQRGLKSFLAQTQCDSVRSYKGEYQGQVAQGFEDFSSLSDLGYWVIDHAENRSGIRGDSFDNVQMQVVLETGLDLKQLASKLPKWHWQALEHGTSQALMLPEESQNYWVDWLHLLASEREVWRRSPSFLSFYKSLHDQVREQFSVSIDDAIQVANRSNLRVMSQSISLETAHGINLYRGRVFLLDDQSRATQVLPLSESVVPVYCLYWEDQTIVFPAFRVTVISEKGQVAQVPLDTKVWCYGDSGWESVETLHELSPLVSIVINEDVYWLQPNSLARDYGVVLRATFLPKTTHNVWNVRGQFYKEPMLPEESFCQSLMLRHSGAVYGRCKNRSPVMFQFASTHGIELYADMVIGITPYRSVVHLMPGFVYHGGYVLPLIESGDLDCSDDDLVIFIESKGINFAFRGQYSSDKNTVHKLVDADAIMLNWHQERIRITLKEDGWFLLDQRHTYFFLKQLLEILE